MLSFDVDGFSLLSEMVRDGETGLISGEWHSAVTTFTSSWLIWAPDGLLHSSVKKTDATKSSK